LKNSLDIIQISDLHIAEPSRSLPDSAHTTEDSLNAVLDSVYAESPELLLCTGDLTNHPNTDAYKRLRDLLGDATCPVYCLPGNHDEPAMARQITEVEGSPIRWDKVIIRNPWLIIMLDSHVEGKIYGHLPDEELAFLESTLQQHPELHTLVCLHHHPVPMRSEWLDGHILQNPEAFFALLDQHPQVKAVTWGHVHQDYLGYHNGIQLIGTPSTCFQFLPGSDDFAYDNRPPAYRQLSLMDDGNLTTNLIYRELTL
jgi:Icc protein